MKNRVSICMVSFCLAGTLYYAAIHAMNADPIEFKVPVADSHVVFTCDRNQQEFLTKKTYKEVMENPHGVLLGVTLCWSENRIICQAYEGLLITRWFKNRSHDPVSRERIMNVLYYLSINSSDPLFCIGSFDEIEESILLHAAVSAASGDSKGMCVLGCLYEDGNEGVPKDYTKARIWYERAIENGNEDALTCLGDLYQEGLGVEQDAAKAKEFYQRALVSTHELVRGDAQKRLGMGEEE